MRDAASTNGPANDTIGSAMPLPDLSPEQRAAALEKAAAARKARAELREQLKSKGATVGDVLKEGRHRRGDRQDARLRGPRVPARSRQGPGCEDHGAPGDLPDPPRARSGANQRKALEAEFSDEKVV